ncbi:MAG: DUF2191 domain-containing protein [Myxococcota bacterium]
MKTTIELPDELFIRAKKRAAELRRPLRSIFEDALRAELDALSGPRAPAERKIRWVDGEGGLPSGVDLNDRAAMVAWMQGERTSR